MRLAMMLALTIGAGCVPMQDGYRSVLLPDKDERFTRETLRELYGRPTRVVVRGGVEEWTYRAINAASNSWDVEPMEIEWSIEFGVHSKAGCPKGVMGKWRYTAIIEGANR